jgi:hypothetical protein
MLASTGRRLPRRPRHLNCGLGGEQEAVEYWQVKRGGGSRGIIEIIGEKP